MLRVSSRSSLSEGRHKVELAAFHPAAARASPRWKSENPVACLFMQSSSNLALKPAGRCAVSRRYAYQDAAAPGTAALRQRAIRNWPLFAIFSTGALDRWLLRRVSWSSGQSLLPLR